MYIIDITYKIGKKGSLVLPKIANALQNFVKPIAPLKKEGMSVQATSETGVGDTGKKENPTSQDKPKLRLVPKLDEGENLEKGSKDSSQDSSDELSTEAHSENDGEENYPSLEAAHQAAENLEDENPDVSKTLPKFVKPEKSVTQTFLQLFESIKTTKNQVLLWVAKTSYQSGIKKQKKGAKAKKGALLDENY